MEEFKRIKRLPPYVFAIVNDLKVKARARGEDIIDFGMGNPDLPTPVHIVEKLCESAHNARNHRYSASRGITKLRHAICDWYRRRHGVELDPETEAIATIGAKEGLSHLALAIVEPGDVALVPNPTYPIHAYSVIIAGGDVRHVRLTAGEDFFENLMAAFRESWPQPKLLILSFPHNPTTAVVDLEFSGRLEPPTTLAEVKQSKKFEDWALVRQGRLSTMAAPDKFVEWMRARYPKAKI